MQNNQLCYLTIIEAAAALRKNDVSPVDLTEATLKRIQAIDSNLHAFITVTADLALQQARQAKQELSAGKDRGPLHGIPIALKIST
jgi:Asp-tRNA(Asn)/Glu-tRNA(Gln) amidotransferase A subunit family amidase